MDTFADTHGFERDFAYQCPVGMADGKRNKFGVSFAFEYTKEAKIVIFHRFKKLFELLNFKEYSNVRVTKFSSRFLCYMASLPILYLVYLQDYSKVYSLREKETRAHLPSTSSTCT